MLIRRADLERIAAGEIDLAFRRWKRPTVRQGGSLTTAVGVLAIDEMEIVRADTISEADAARAGFPSRAALIEKLAARAPLPVYRLRLRLAGDDPREALRENAELTSIDIEAITTRLERLDSASSSGPWSNSTLELIAQRPGALAAALADSLAMERDRFKRNVRKLKALGLTESLPLGYRLSPRGHAYRYAMKARRRGGSITSP